MCVCVCVQKVSLVILSLTAPREAPSWDSWVSGGSCVLNGQLCFHSLLSFIIIIYSKAKQSRRRVMQKFAFIRNLFFLYVSIFMNYWLLYLFNASFLWLYEIPHNPGSWPLLYTFNPCKPNFLQYIFLPSFHLYFLLLPNPPQCSTAPDLL